MAYARRDNAGAPPQCPKRPFTRAVEAPRAAPNPLGRPCRGFFTRTTAFLSDFFRQRMVSGVSGISPRCSDYRKVLQVFRD